MAIFWETVTTILQELNWNKTKYGLVIYFHSRRYRIVLVLRLSAPS